MNVPISTVQNRDCMEAMREFPDKFFDLGFDFWGYELDADYFAAMEARFQAHISKPVLFAPEQMYRFEQAELFNEETR